ncbi:MAG TPA: alpha-glucan family phosphorylase [Steroidobacteraceae bacterium]|jgi:starch phosphorylase|nr:alpha-glucan family phosphorylase [Steroidobacteraceae bacterium]
MTDGLHEFTREPRVAYFSMEIALRSQIGTYAGGLGVLAGDTLRSAADLSLPLVGVCLVSREGYFHQDIDAQGNQRERPATWNPADFAQPLDARVAVRFEGRTVWVGAWLYVIESHMGGSAPVILLDTYLPENHPEDRELTHYLYGGDEVYRLKQEIILGLGGVRILHALGFEIETYHMNEGHSALLGLELLRRFAWSTRDLRPGESPYDLPRVRELCCFTTHTPVDAGHDRFAYELVQRLLFGSSPLAENAAREMSMLRSLGGEDALNMTRLALNLSEFVNGVARRHAEVSQRMFPGFRVRAITNGIHPFTWTAASFRELYDHYIPGWCHEPELLVRADRIPQAAILAAHARAKQALIDTVTAATGITLKFDVPILAFARRMTAYKRPDMLFTDLERLKAVAHASPFQILLAGKAHPHDAAGKELIATLHRHMAALGGAIACVYLHDYDMAMALSLVSGADLWLNTPLPPYEASGTSGMKAAFNGVPSLSVLDGWWMEGCIEGVTGWAIDDAASIYDKLERVILPLFYGNEQHGGWTAVMQGCITKNAAYFNSHRMMRRYATEAYLR